MKRKILLFSLILVMVCMSLALLGSDTPDGNLSMDEDDFVELVVDAPLSLHYLESVYSLKSVNQIVGNEGEDGFAEVLYNANDEAEYVLATAEEGGYAIFHRMTGALMEAGEFGASPYAGQSGKKYYFGPSNYAVKDVNDVTTDIMRGGVMTTEQITAMHQYMAEKRALVVARSETKSYTSMLSALQTANTAEQQGDASLMNVVPGGWETDPYAAELSISDFTNVADSYIFKYSYGSQTFGKNSHGSCEAVSLVLLMKYLDQTTAPGIIPATKGVIPTSWYNECNNCEILYHKGSAKALADGKPEFYSCTITAEDSVYEALHKYLNALSNTTQFPVTHSAQITALSAYNAGLQNCTSVELVQYSATSEENMFSMSKGYINSNVPIKIVIDYCLENNDETIECAHSIVAYGYYDAGEYGKYYRAHFGWAECASIVVPSYFVRDYGGYMNANINLYHDGHNTCIYENCFSKNKHIVTPTQYGHTCSCGEDVVHSGEDATYIWQDYSGYEADQARTFYVYVPGSITETHHYYVCNDCFEYVYGYELTNEVGWAVDIDAVNTARWTFPEIMRATHSIDSKYASNNTCMARCICGYTYQIPHSTYNYTQKNFVSHIKTCSLCGYTEEETHNCPPGVLGCILCGWNTGGNVVAPNGG